MTYDSGSDHARIGFVRASARRLLAACGIHMPPVDLRVVVATLGITYHEVDLPRSVSAYCCEHGGARYAIVNRLDHPHRQRFSLAHEIGHLELFHDSRFIVRELVDIDRPPAVTYSRANDPLEREANVFAGELLVPLTMLKKACADGIDLARLGELFDVSEEVATIAVQTHLRSLQPTRSRRQHKS